MNAGGSGFSVGNIATTTISGTLPYHQNLIDNNSDIWLYKRSNNTWALMYCWFMKNGTIHDNSSLSFSGVDAAAFTSNNYAVGWQTDPDRGVLSYDTIGKQVSETIPTTLSTLCGSTITVTPCNSNTVNTACLVDRQATKSIKSTLEEVAKFDASNYYTRCTSESAATLLKVQSSGISISEYAPLTVGQYNTSIVCVKVRGSKGTDPVYTYGNAGSARGTLDISCAYVDGLSTWYTQVEDGVNIKYAQSIKVEPTSYQALVGSGSGRVFSCEKAYVEDSMVTGEFLVPMSYITFTHDTYTGNQFILTSAQYFLTSEGVYASLSGSARSVSDFEYVGTTEKDVRNKLDMNRDYGGCMFTWNEGIKWKENPDTEAVNSG